ncbi:ABC transporter ATP-binding protein [Prochlorococcus sp. MIT 1223]|uniref:ABC transporter ATP-binding protein n=1 Tax=Prochlorococcus sp. MIT 1223 TaxID=3096217 RepID=UPI002A761D71|nr:ABC transporter ATP-binding protein [Prochlorococcus sp. MIT 1223]
MGNLIAENLSFAYERREVVENISLTLLPGTMTALVGPNGAGKSTLLKLLKGESKPYRGKVTVNGQPLKNSRDQVALMPQRNSINWDFPITVQGLVALGRINYSTCCDIEACLQRVGMSKLAKRRLDSLSGGQQQRALLAKTLMRPASIFLLDEPCSALDPPTREQFLTIIRQLADAGLTICVTSHDWGKSLNAYDKVIAIDKKILGFGTPTDVQEKLDSITCMGNYCCG